MTMIISAGPRVAQREASTLRVATPRVVSGNPGGGFSLFDAIRQSEARRSRPAPDNSGKAPNGEYVGMPGAGLPSTHVEPPPSGDPLKSESFVRGIIANREAGIAQLREERQEMNQEILGLRDQLRVANQRLQDAKGRGARDERIAELTAARDELRGDLDAARLKRDALDDDIDHLGQDILAMRLKLEEIRRASLEGKPEQIKERRRVLQAEIRALEERLDGGLSDRARKNLEYELEIMQARHALYVPPSDDA